MKQIQAVLHNIRSTYNVGAILRTAEGLGVERLVFSGYTPRYGDPRILPHLRTKLDHQIEKSALGAEKLVVQTGVENLAEWLHQQKQAGWDIVGLENNLASDELAKQWILGDKSPKLGDKIVVVLGEEVSGIPPSIREEMDYFLEIPMQGQKESFNVSIATAIALWELKKKA